MAATSAATASIGSTVFFCSKATAFQQTKPVGVEFNTTSFCTGFSGLKALISVNCEMESSFLGKESNSALRCTSALKAQNHQTDSYPYYVQPEASFKVAILGAAGGIGQSLALRIKMSPLISTLHLYDIADVKGVAANLSHCSTPQVLNFTGTSELARKPGMTQDDLFNINANVIKTWLRLLPITAQKPSST